MEYAQLLVGLVTLLLSGEFLVKGAVGIALRLRVSTLVIGMTIVSFGTSAPELLVSVIAALKGSPDIAVGAVLGSNISNLALILGLTTLIFPVNVNRDTIAVDWPMMMISTIIFYLFILDGILLRMEGVILLAMILWFTAWLIRRSRKNEKLQNGEEKTLHHGAWLYVKDSVMIVVGCVGLAFGTEWFLEGAENIALSYGISQRVIALTLIAVGTSLPELITSLVAAMRHHTDISVGNLIGSNIFNLLSILGITALIKEIPIHEMMLGFDIYWVLFISAALLPLMLHRRRITRLNGAVLLLLYIIYVYFVITHS